MAIEDAAALGILFSKNAFNGNVEQTLEAYQLVRLPRATRVQAAAAKAAYNINERIGEFHIICKKKKMKRTSFTDYFIQGFSCNKNTATYKVEDPKNILTIEEMNA